MFLQPCNLSIRHSSAIYVLLLLVTVAVSWEEWWTYDGISGKLEFIRTNPLSIDLPFCSNGERSCMHCPNKCSTRYLRAATSAKFPPSENSTRVCWIPRYDNYGTTYLENFPRVRIPNDPNNNIYCLEIIYNSVAHDLLSTRMFYSVIR